MIVNGSATLGNGVDLAVSVIDVAKAENNFLGVIGGMNGILPAPGALFNNSIYGSNSGADNPGYADGVDAPTATTVKRIGESQVCENFLEVISVDDIQEAVSQTSVVSDLRGSEMDFQMETRLLDLGGKVKKSCLISEFDDGSVSGVRKMRGLVNAISTGKLTANDGSGDPDELTKAYLKLLGRRFYDLNPSGKALIVCNSEKKDQIDTLYEDKNPTSIDVAGTKLTLLNLPNVSAGIIVDNDVPDDTIMMVDGRSLRLRGIRYPKFGNAFVYMKPLGSKGTYDALMIACTLGLDYGSESKHVMLTNLV
jgi:hypothetical protein